MIDDVMTPNIASLAPVEIVAAEDVEAAVAAAHEEFADLERRVADAVAAAEREEERASALHVDPNDGPRAIANVQRFIDEWSDRVNREAQQVLDAARAGSRVRLDDARAEAERVRRAHPRALTTPLVERSPASPPVEEIVLESTPNVSNGAAVVADASDAIAVPGETPEAQATNPPATNGSTPPNEAGPDLAHDPVPSAPPRLPPEAPSSVPEAPPFASTPPAGVVPAPVVPAVPAVPAVPVPGATPAADAPDSEASTPEVAGDAGFWTPPTPEVKKTRRLLGPISLSAVFEVVAVLLVLVFILLRLS